MDFDNLDAYDRKLEQEIKSYEAMIQSKKSDLKLASSQAQPEEKVQKTSPEERNEISVSQYFTESKFEPDEGILKQTDEILVNIMSKYPAGQHSGINLVTLHETLHGKVSRPTENKAGSASVSVSAKSLEDSAVIASNPQLLLRQDRAKEFLKPTNTQLCTTAQHFDTLMTRKKEQYDKYIQMPQPQQFQALKVCDTQFERDSMKKVQNSVAAGGISWTGYSDNFISADWSMPKPVKAGMPKDEAETQAKKRLFWKMKMIEHARQVMFSVSKLELPEIE